ncbi:hypothetical protein EDD86DRAFT_219265 [Gorgonomyces haynaldii]|nr:hypothetical protein EDD86DRAFT_219265 [Gorgonomyces haynaldii]
MEFVRQVFPDVSDLKIMGILADYNFELKSDSQYLGISLLGQQDGTFGCFLVIDLGLNIVQCQKTRLDDGLVTFQFLSVSENQCVLVYQNWQGEWSRMCVHRLSDWHKIYEIPLQPQLTIQRIFSRSSGLVMLGWDKERQGIVMHLDHSGTIVKCITFGEKITCFGESHPYIPDCCVTGHENKIVCIWTLDGQLKHTLVGHRKNIWGFAFMDDPDDRDSDTLHWKEPHRLMLISVADDGSLSEHAELLTWVIDTQPTVKPLTEHWMTFPRGDLFAVLGLILDLLRCLSLHLLSLIPWTVLSLESGDI